MEVTQAFITLTVNLGKKFKNQMIVSIQEVKEAGISQRAIDYIYNTKQAILEDEAFKDTIKAIRATDSIPQNAIEIATADQNAIAQIKNGQGKTFVLRSNLNFVKTLSIPSNVTIYVDGTITKKGLDLYFLPSHAPELQPAERLWPLTNEVIANNSPHSLKELEELLIVRCRKLLKQQDKEVAKKVQQSIRETSRFVTISIGIS